jgi:hypothetical protein
MVNKVNLHPCEVVNFSPPNLIASFNMRLDVESTIY